jgi:hypothetical protein
MTRQPLIRYLLKCPLRTLKFRLLISLIIGYVSGGFVHAIFFWIHKVPFAEQPLSSSPGCSLATSAKIILLESIDGARLSELASGCFPSLIPMMELSGVGPGGACGVAGDHQRLLPTRSSLS